MKKINSLTLLAFFWLISISAFCQINQDQIAVGSEIQYIVTKNDKTVFIGRILSIDAREVLVETIKSGQVIIPKHDIASIAELRADTKLPTEDNLSDVSLFSTRYFFTTNGYPIGAGEGYINYFLWGPEFHFGITDELSLGVLTTWLAIPIVASLKYSPRTSGDVRFAVGGLFGTLSWVDVTSGVLLPYGAVTVGTPSKNINFSAGYGLAYGGGSAGGAFLGSIGGAAPINKKVSFIFDSIFFIDGSTVAAILIPGFRFQSDDRKAFQFGFTGLVIDGEAVPAAIPFVSWLRKF